MNQQAEIKMNVDQFLAWSENQVGRFELVEGEAIPMSPERAIHNLTKFYAVRALSDAIRKADVDCTAYTDGMGVRVNRETLIEPDASIQIGKPVDKNAKELSAPVVVVEVLSPSTSKNDVSTKLVDYMTVETIAHYLVIDGDLENVVHYRKITPTQCETTILTSGSIRLDPPGIEVAIAAFFGKS